MLASCSTGQPAAECRVGCSAAYVNLTASRTEPCCGRCLPASPPRPAPPLRPRNKALLLFPAGFALSQLPYLVSNIVEVLDVDPEEEEEEDGERPRGGWVCGWGGGGDAGRHSPHDHGSIRGMTGGFPGLRADQRCC